MKLLVAATPISGPQFRGIEISLSRINEEPGALTKDIILVFLNLASCTALSTSAVSPLCEIVRRTSLSFNKSA